MSYMDPKGPLAFVQTNAGDMSYTDPFDPVSAPNKINIGWPGIYMLGICVTQLAAGDSITLSTSMDNGASWQNVSLAAAGQGATVTSGAATAVGAYWVIQVPFQLFKLTKVNGGTPGQATVYICGK